MTLDRTSPSARTTLSRLTRRALTRARCAAQDLGPRARRAVDIAASLAGILALAPLFALAALALKLDSRGPVFYSQERLGRGGRRFRLFKLRTMITQADQQKSALAGRDAQATSGVRFKLRRDPRITRVGRVLRKLSIDELPQLLNVLVGDMTLLGPRPPIWKEVSQYAPLAMRRLEVTPGLTCLWQVSGRSDLSFDQQVSLDIEYIDRVRPSQEIAIVLRTIPAVLTGRGAY
jgi:lipopolysaccharide/colanic/teichoic acid biosynthesis glycosyltransferase